MQKKHTFNKQNDVQSRMDHGLHHSDDGHMAMEYVERRKTPASRPEENVVSTGKNP